MLGLTLIHVSKTGYKRRYVNWNSTAWQLSVRTKLSYRGLTTAFNAPKPEQNCHHFAGDVLKYISLKGFFIQLKFLLTFINSVDNQSTLIDWTSLICHIWQSTGHIMIDSDNGLLPEPKAIQMLRRAPLGWWWVVRSSVHSQIYQPEEGASYHCQVRLCTQIGGFPGYRVMNEPIEYRVFVKKKRH